MKNYKKSILILHLSDMHIRNKSDINSHHIQKIVDSLNTYKSSITSDMLLIISGDLSCTGKKEEFKSVSYLIGHLIREIKMKLSIENIKVLVVPGNHDVNHNEIAFDMTLLSNGRYSEIEIREHDKQKEFYVLSKFNNCFSNDEIYHDVKNIEISGFKIQVNLINNAIFSYCGNYKGLLYMPNNYIQQMTHSTHPDFVLTVMHHSPDYYRDEIKNSLEENVINKSNILFHGHEHNNTYKITEFQNKEKVIIQSCGALCDKGNWENGSFIAGILDIDTKKYQYSRFAWNSMSSQYEHDNIKENTINDINENSFLSEDFIEFINNNYNEEYFTFPSVILHTQTIQMNQQINTFDNFLKEILNFHKIIISGDNSMGKTSLLLKLFKSLSSEHTVIYCSSELILQKSGKKRQNLDKLIKSCYEDIYGNDKSKWQSFEQLSKEKCVFIFDDFDQVYDINTEEFMKQLSTRFGIIIISTNQAISFDPKNIIVSENENIAKFDIKPLLGRKRKELIRKVVKNKSDDKTESTISNVVEQINTLIKSQVSIIPPEPYYIIQIAENFINNIGEVVNSNVTVFSKVFESNITSKIDKTIRKYRYNSINIELMYVILSKIAHYIHFHKTYPISRNQIAYLVDEYNREYGNALYTEDILKIALKSKILINSKENSEVYRFRNKSLLAYFVAREVVGRFQDTKDSHDLEDIINKCCINICTDILFFIIYQTDDISILRSIMNSIASTLNSDSKWQEFDVKGKIPTFFENYNNLNESNKIDIENEKKSIEKVEEKTEETILTELKVRDVYDWDDSLIDDFNNRLIKMVSLLHIIAKALPSFEHRLKKVDKQRLIGYLYTLPNSIFMYWALTINDFFDEIIKEIMPYMASNNSKAKEKDKDKLARIVFASYAVELLLNLYYIAALNASSPNTYLYLNNIDMYDYTQKETYKLQHLMFTEQNNDSFDFISTAINLKEEVTEDISKVLLAKIVRHGIITRNDSFNNVNRLESKFGLSQRNKLGISENKKLLLDKRKFKSTKK